MDAINQPLLDVRDLSVAFHQQSGTSTAVDRISFSIRRGERIAQMIIASVVRAELVPATSLSTTDRGAGGFGSTGR